VLNMDEVIIKCPAMLMAKDLKLSEEPQGRFKLLAGRVREEMIMSWEENGEELVWLAPRQHEKNRNSLAIDFGIMAVQEQAWKCHGGDLAKPGLMQGETVKLACFACRVMLDHTMKGKEPNKQRNPLSHWR
jgi:hypothetical protein